MQTPPEFKKSDPWDYNAKVGKAQILKLEARKFATISGTGDPNGADFAGALGAMYGLCYAVRMSYRNANTPLGSGPYTVGVLQGLWDLVDHQKGFDKSKKDNLAWTLMIRQPDFLTPESWSHFIEIVRSKSFKKNGFSSPWFDKLRLEMRGEGLFAQTLHLGPYDDEPATFDLLERLAIDAGYLRSSKTHYELYLGDPRKSEPAKLKTILRIVVEKKEHL